MSALRAATHSEKTAGQSVLPKSARNALTAHRCNALPTRSKPLLSRDFRLSASVRQNARNALTHYRVSAYREPTHCGTCARSGAVKPRNALTNWNPTPSTREAAR